MKVVFVLSAILCVVTTAPSRPIVVPDLPAHHVHATPVAVVTSQSHAQDELGQYSYSYSNPHSSKVEVKTVDGITRGGYSYLDSHGLVQNVNYVSDDVNGFRVAASNLPLGRVTPQEDEPLVAHEKAKAVAALHDAALKEAAEAAVAHENEVALVSVAIEAPVPTPNYVAHPSPVPHADLPAVYASTAPEVHVTPAPISLVSPAVSPVVHITPTPYPEPHSNHPSKPLVTPVSYYDHPHSYATVELDTSDIPAPVPSPGAYFHPAPTNVGHKSAPVFVSSTAAPTVYEEFNPVEVAAPAPSPTPLAYSTPSHIADSSPAHYVHAPATSVRVGPAPILHHRSTPVVHEKPIPFYHENPAPVAHAIPTRVVHTTPAPIYFEASTPVVHPHAPAYHEVPTPFYRELSTPVVHATPAPLYNEVPTPVVHAVPTQTVHVTPEPVYHEVPTPVVHAVPTPVVHATPEPLYREVSTPVVHAAPERVYHEAPTPVVHAVPTPVVHDTPEPVYHEPPTPVIHDVPTHVVSKAPVAVVTSQSHAQDELGQYSYSYSNPLSSKVEVKTVDGITRGGYSYLDSHGLVQNVNYVSDDHNGFQVAASNLPKAAVPVDIPDSHDVAAAKAVFFAEIAKAKAAAYHH